MALALAIAVLICWLSHRYLRLASVPGPFLAAITDFWRWNAHKKALFYGPVLTDLHRKYGRLVRIGPNIVSVADLPAVPFIYGGNPVLEKVSKILITIWNDNVLIAGTQGSSYSVTVGTNNGRLVRNLIALDEA